MERSLYTRTLEIFGSSLTIDIQQSCNFYLFYVGDCTNYTWVTTSGQIHVFPPWLHLTMNAQILWITHKLGTVHIISSLGLY